MLHFLQEDTISINHNWLNGCNVDISWEYIKQGLRDVRSIDFACFYNFVTTYGGKLATMIERTMEKRHIIKSGFGL
jgi:hypothetical protein